MAKKGRPSDSSRTFPPVTTASKESAELFDTTHKSKHWLDPIGMSQLQNAVRKRAKTAIIHGRSYDLSYGHMIQLSDGERETVKVKRSDGVMAPFGYVNLAKILAFDFESTKD